MKVTPKSLVQFLKAKNEGHGFIDSLKISYRPYICPFDTLLNKLPENQSIADLGCGSGMYLSLVDEFKKPKKLLGIEIEQRLVDNARGLLKSSSTPHEIYQYDGKSLPEHLNEFDFVYLIDVLHHIPLEAQDKYLADVYAKMKSGATLIIKDINGASVLKYWNKFHDMLLAGEIGKEPKPKELIAKLTNLGFDVSEPLFQLKFLYAHFTIECQK